MTAIQTNNLTKIFGSKKVVDAINLNVEKGKVFGFLGPNGAGKTTTIRMLLGLVKPSFGTAKILGYEVKNEYHKIADKVAAIVETPTFFPYLNAIQTLQTFADYCRLEKSLSEIEELLDKCGILYASRNKVDSFSLGMKQRLGIAAALLSNPQVIFLDEPTNGLDPSGIVETRKLIRQLADEESRTVFISSHLLNEVEQICDEVAILNKGKVKVSGKVSELLQNKRVTVKTIPSDKTEKVLRENFPEITFNYSIEEEKFFLDINADIIPHLIEKLVQNKIEVYEVFQSGQTLEEFFHQTVQK